MINKKKTIQLVVKVLLYTLYIISSMTILSMKVSWPIFFRRIKGLSGMDCVEKIQISGVECVSFFFIEGGVSVSGQTYKKRHIWAFINNFIS